MSDWLLWIILINTFIPVFLFSPQVVGGALFGLFASVITLLFVGMLLFGALFECYQKLSGDEKEKGKEFIKKHTQKLNIE